MESIQSQTVGSAFDEIVARFAEKEALVYEDERISYRELQRRVHRMAKGLMALGLQKDEKMAVWMNNNPEWIYAFLASAKIGSVFVSVNARFKMQELEFVLRQSDSTTLLFKALVHKTDYYELFAGLCPEVRSSKPGKLSSPRFPLLRNVICVAQRTPPGVFTVEEVMALGEAKVSDGELAERQKAIRPDDLVMLQYTSGTTSFPKGCMTAHYPVILDVWAMGRNMDLRPEDRIFCPLPFYHVGGSLITFFMGVLAGATIVTTEHFEAGKALEIIQWERCTAMNGVETLWLELLRHPHLDRYDIHTLKKGWAIGPPELLRNVAEKLGVKRFVNTYGLSEQTANTGTTQADDPLEFKIHWNGRPHPGSEMKIVDPQTGSPLPPGQMGEICVRGFNVMKGYYKMPEETRKVIDAEGWLHTGDMGVMDEKGNFRFAGRIKDTLRVGGENVSAIEVESFLLQHPAVRMAQVIGVPDPRLVEVPMAVIQLKEGQRATESEIIAFCQGKLSSFKIPRYVWFVEEFPLTGSGKVQKYKLREEALKRIKGGGV